uniref:Uncharacterized protein n=1 Tax=Cereibacter sphaeroides (strain ATCC 17025 / ATH 2.4.3) TaxID=349102 RepID=A4WNQ2_CERS5
MSDALTVAATLHEIRDHLKGLDAEAQRIAEAPQPIEDGLSTLDQWLDREAEAGLAATPVAALLDSRTSAAGLTRTPVFADGKRSLEPDLNALRGLVLALPPVRHALRELVKGQLADLTRGIETMSPSTRQKKLARVADERLALELREEHLIRSAERAGIAVTRRPSADGRVLLAADAALS